ncbi:hypothetical protein M011DRAFT_460972 [Sporormia fimetaria CBS 119925]|uniref:tRNA (adenine(58)-N(1))-methyltransferase non-catalytic subunit TRM6 n=1 Tax=Sporormia fimetaria CBS 119925 TaxID=1340428 RepID=A0A6A6V409_9PLEO|nr:hypothetical protein M011DRAFT_460972 [Sporormia fimetaria CBS 119925]
MHSYIRPNTHIALRLSSGILKVVEIAPNTNINIGKFGTFPANLLLGRPYYLTYELSDKEDGVSKTQLRVVPAAELHAEALGEDYGAAVEAREEPTEGGVEFDIVAENGDVIMRSNRLTVDDPSRQTLSMEEIEELKKAGTGSGKEIIAKIMEAHKAIDEKTTFSLAKYTLRKSKKYLRRFTVFPLDLGTLLEYVSEREAWKVMDLREESLGLINSWANVHFGGASRVMTADDGISQVGGGRWLVVDDTGGLVVAGLAEKMGILYPTEAEDVSEDEENVEEPAQPNPQTEDTPMPDATATKDSHGTHPDGTSNPSKESQPNGSSTPSSVPPPRKPHVHIPQMDAPTNHLTIVHANNQPNLALLKYFSFDAGNPTPSHPLHKHLKSLSWLQLLHPEDDPTYAEPEHLPDEDLAKMKSSKRGTYYKKRRRWERTSRIVDETRRGGFDGLVVATAMEATSILRELVPLVKGGGKVVVYSPNVEPLVELCDYYSKDRRAAFLARQVPTNRNGAFVDRGVATPGTPTNGIKAEEEDEEVERMTSAQDEEDFPVNPMLLLAPSLQTARARHYQVLPGRTHPMMTSKGGAEGYLFTGTRVIPVEGKVEARGSFRYKKRKTAPESAVPA